MAGLFDSLNATAGSLTADSFALSVTSNNLSNVNNANYAREYVVFGSQGQVQTPQGTLGLGIVAESVQQDASALLDQQVMQQASLTSSDQAQQDWLQQAQAGLDETLTPGSSGSAASSATTGDGGLSSALDTLMNDFSDLAADPTNAGEKATVVEDASTLASTINSIDQNLAQVQSDAGSQISSDVSTANTLLGQIATLNGQIATAEVGSPGSAVDLRDERETDLESLAAIIPITSTEQSNGAVTVTTPDTSGNGVALVQGASTLGALNYADGVLTGGSSATALGLSGGGSIQGAIAASTGPIQDLRNSLDSLSQQLVTSVNAAYNPSGAAGGNFFDPAGTTASTIALASGLTANTLVAGTGAAGDNSIATAVAALANTPFSTAGGDAIDGTFDSYYAQAVSTFGSTVSDATSNLTDQTNVQTLIQNQRSTYSGVNMDEEMSNLIQYQRAYEASSQVFSILNQLLGTTITELGNSS